MSGCSAFYNELLEPAFTDRRTADTAPDYAERFGYGNWDGFSVIVQVAADFDYGIRIDVGWQYSHLQVSPVPINLKSPPPSGSGR
ncbi:MAG: hypothetical protein EOS65_03080 [Mesorhizobium sp.]|uniref:hypothetical protein n=1 Tax=Mesorhizobium sp. TaxID=1871066 RepID=UPI000FE55358|nr:hypothetical protein [Mesorhizobium sp.]RWF28714.1 MAG: hypothetical protein EOS45_21505 [Mesorhizobium sp.]RWF44125.1 MAG: hypothetical protein EOS65_03080 [Mesorhizobium sp.]TJW03574.1 MAG: hypothetical protein E5W97_18785 [Mesorhizobium sp.]